MGMAASQARFLQLTARRTNIEYMGQQINQQRLALANQSAGLFEKMLTLEPPVPPSSLDDKYYTQGYTFTDLPAAESSTGSDVFQGDGVNKKISWSTTFDAASFDIVVTDTDGAGDGDDGGTITVAYADLVNEETENATGADMQRLLDAMGFSTQNDTSKAVMRYVTIEHSIYDPNGDYQVVQEQAPAILEFDHLNRLVNATVLEDGLALTLNGDITNGGAAVTDLSDLDNMAAGSTNNFSSVTNGEIGDGDELTYSGVFDQESFNDDMNEYEFAKSAYDYQIERINLETAQIQKQDKSLELKMKQLDTEHNAIQTEMDAVQKVIQKNIEGSFKTFA